MMRKIDEDLNLSIASHITFPFYTKHSIKNNSAKMLRTSMEEKFIGRFPIYKSGYITHTYRPEARDSGRCSGKMIREHTCVQLCV